MEVTQAGEAANNVGGEAVLIPHLSGTAKAPEHV
jgi:hypothetical protein